MTKLRSKRGGTRGSRHRNDDKPERQGTSHGATGRQYDKAGNPRMMLRWPTCNAIGKIRMGNDALGSGCFTRSQLKPCS